MVGEVPGHYFVGLFFMTAAESSLIGGVDRDAALVADHIATHRQSPGGSEPRSSVNETVMEGS